jgi:hypothetical protein
MDLSGILALPGGAALALDLTGTEYDAKAELQALGVPVSDADAPFPGTLYGPATGSWSHAAVLGWRPAVEFPAPVAAQFFPGRVGRKGVA